jgi:hypothetical protein
VKIGTDLPIRLSMSGRAIPSDQAVKISVLKTDKKKNKSYETFYVGNLSKPIDPIFIYSEGTNATSKTWYESIKITISVVDIEKFSLAPHGPNTALTVRNASTGKAYNPGDLIESSQKVTITIMPYAGYDVSGKKAANGRYSQTMEYADYLKKISDIIRSHPAKKK